MPTGNYSREYLTYEHDKMFCGLGDVDPTDIYLILVGSSGSFSETLNKASVIANELTVAGYARQRYGNKIASIGSNTITTQYAHNLTANYPVYVSNYGGSLPSGLSTATKYYVINPTSNTLQLSATSGGSALSISGGSGSTYILPSVAWDAVDGRVEAPKIKYQITATADATFQAIAMLMNGDPDHTFTVSNINTSNGQITTAAHGRTTGDQVVFAADSGGTQPGNTSASTVYYARVISSTVVTLHPTAADASGNTNTVIPSNTGSGTIRLRPANGIVFAWYRYASAQSLFANIPIAPELTFNRKFV